MPTLLIHFPARRYHATPWGHHVNEGLIEWPPSPWRLSRALLATGYATDQWKGDRPPPVAQSMIEKLASVLPAYRLPKGAGAHTRHYMPLGRFKNGQEDKTLVLDTWGYVTEGPLLVTWDVGLDDIEKELLAVLVSRLGYLGRSESWVEARLLNEGEDLTCCGEPCYPTDSPPPQGWEQVSLLAPQPKEDYKKWKEMVFQQVSPDPPGAGASGKAPSKRAGNRVQQRLGPYPEDLIACLQATTPWLKKHGWSQPPGSRKVFYLRRAGDLRVGSMVPHKQMPCAPTVECMLLSMTTPSNNDHALPMVRRTLPQAERLHGAFAGQSLKMGFGCHVLTGCDEEHRRLKGPHEHAHVLPLDLDMDGHIDHVLLWARCGLDAAAQQAVKAIRRTYAKGVVDPLRLAVVGAGGLEDVRALPDVYGASMGAVLGPENGARTWVSLTPFVAPRYLKKSGRNTLAGQVAAELVSRGLPEPQRVQVFEPGRYPEFLHHRLFIRRRQKNPQPPADYGYTLYLHFERPVSGPICLGYASHFGLGLFRAVDEGSYNP